MRHSRKSSVKSVFGFPTLIGFDEEENDSDEENSGEENDSEDEDEEDGSEEDEDESGGDSDKEKKNAAGLKSALQKEREARKQLEKEMKELRKFREEKENEDKTELQKAQDKADKLEKEHQQALEKLRDTQLDFAISAAARKSKFRDIDDALRLINRSEIEFDDDGEFDTKAVEKAVKAVADAKPHLVLSDGESAPSGSKFGGKKKGDKKASEETLKSKYPALGR